MLETVGKAPRDTKTEECADLLPSFLDVALHFWWLCVKVEQLLAADRIMSTVRCSLLHSCRSALHSLPGGIFPFRDSVPPIEDDNFSLSHIQSRRWLYFLLPLPLLSSYAGPVKEVWSVEKHCSFSHLK